ncbi:MAG: 3-oxoacyl-[acyl-carrier-protein] synthase 2 [Isosphaeraceae bacterium]|jgi:3-oxoacyl-[acyl-carrier-protein] synthase II|nr:MAG: 3-oxoacyl-[acyl-carrier-protein] synthase 2 [Isosphaeraceae bacterium]
MREPIVVLGHGAVTALGPTMDATWDGLLSGRSGLRRHPDLNAERFLQDIAGRVEVPLDDPNLAGTALSKLPARFLRLGYLAAREAWLDSGLDQGPGLDRDRVALVLGSAFGGLDHLDAEIDAMARRKSLATSPYLIPGMIVNQLPGQVAERLDLHGPMVAPANACASGGIAIAVGAALIASGEADAALCGAAESVFTPFVVNGFATMKALLGRKANDRSADDPAQASRPFSIDRAGFVLAEGAAALVLCSARLARQRGLRPQAELAGWASNSDGHHMALPEPGRIRQALAAALKHAGLPPSAIDYYNAHGTSTLVNDRVETQAIRDVFGDHAARLPISSIKGALGHSLGAASAIEAAVCIRVLRDQILPPTLHHRPDPELDLDYVPGSARPTRVRAVMSASFGFGGTNNVLVFRRIGDD